MKLAELTQLNEGLIKSESLNTVRRVLRRMLPGLTVNEDVFNNTVIVIFPAITSRVQVSRVMQTIATMGWYPALQFINRTPLRMNVDVDEKYLSDPQYEYAITIEPKYDEEVNLANVRALYHVTPAKYVDRILSKGLTPRTTGKRSDHPERVYLALSLDDLDNIANAFVNDDKQAGRDVAYVALRIDRKKLPKTTKFYRDPNFSSFVAIHGVYTLNSISPAAISVYGTYNG